jgi:hypothetical protein
MKQDRNPATIQRTICGLLCLIVLASVGAYAQLSFGDPGAEKQDYFGRVLARGDFNRDGYQDLVVGVPQEGIAGASGQIFEAGAVEVIYGSARGLSSSGRQFWRQGSGGLPGVTQPGDHFGAALATGDFNGDGFTDLAIGVPHDLSDNVHFAGGVHVLYGSPAGLSAIAIPNQFWRQGSGGVPGATQPDEQFGAALAAGDFNHDGFADLAIGVPGENFCSRTCMLTGNGLVEEAGAVNVIYGSPGGLSTTHLPSQSWRQGVGGILDSAETGDHFGGSLAAGDFNGDGFVDLAIGVPDESLGAIAGAGAVNVIYGSVSGLSATTVPNQFWHQDSPSVQDAAEANDHFGFSLAAGDFSRDGFSDLAVGVPFETIGSAQLAGAVNVIYGSATGLSATHVPNQLIHLDAPHRSDLFGYSLAAGDFDHDGFFDLAIGLPDAAVGAMSEAGMVVVMHGSRLGLVTIQFQVWRQDVTTVPDTAEALDSFGAALAAGDFNGDGRDDLAVGVPNETLDSAGGPIQLAGAVDVIYDTAAIPNQFWTQLYLLPPKP